MARRQERGWPTWPVPVSFLKQSYAQIVAIEWPDVPTWTVLDESALRSALLSPFATVGGTDAYPTVRSKAACLFRGLVKNHALADGNKRMGVVATTVFLVVNGWEPVYSNSELYKYALRVASRRGNYPVEWIEGWIKRKTRLLPAPDLLAARRQLERFRASIDDDIVAWIETGEVVLDAPRTSGRRMTATLSVGEPG